VVIAVVVASIGAAVYLIWPFWQISVSFGTRELQQPSRLYARATELRIGTAATIDGLIADLKAAGYERASGEDLIPGRYRTSPGRLEVHLRAFPTSQGWSRPGHLAMGLRGRTVVSLGWEGRQIDRAVLEPPLLATFYGPDLQERRPVDLSELPQHFIDAVLAAEDAGFFGHSGLSLKGMARAAWVNLSGGELRQGGSTVTQQLVKNLFLTHERTLIRKLREAVLAILIDWRYEKRSILNAYLNEIYWGKSGRANLMGVGAASWAYFGSSADALSLCQSALLAGIIRSPGGYSPISRPEEAVKRRNWVLERMGKMKKLEPDAVRVAQAEPLCVSPHSVDVQHASYFVDTVRQEAAQRFGVHRLGGAGLAILSTLEMPDQQVAVRTVEAGLKELESKWEKHNKASHVLQAALVSLDPQTGEILAYVGRPVAHSSQLCMLQPSKIVSPRPQRC
jgi:penicillin-binding protein 1B